MTRKLGIAVIGLGPASLPHSKSLLDLVDRAETRWAVSRTPDRAKAYAAQFPFPTTTDLDAVLAAIEAHAREQGIERLIVEASELARPLFERRGFTLLGRNDLLLDGVAIHNYRMEKRLQAPCRRGSRCAPSPPSTWPGSMA